MEGSILLRHGIVFDPINNVNQKNMDVFIHGGRISLIGEHLQLDQLRAVTSEWAEYDAGGCLVCPGLIDLHVHCFPGTTSLGIDPDLTCLSRGVTTVVDAGSTGAHHFTEFLTYIGTRRTRVLCFLNVSRLGLSQAGCATDENSVGELEYLDDVDVDQCIECITANPATVVGTKVRLSASLANSGKNESESLRRALKIRETTRLPLMIHHSFSTIPLEANDDCELGVPGSLFEGDIRTHHFHGFETNIVDQSQGLNHSLHTSLFEARARGVKFDVGHGQGGFSWTVAEISAKEGFWPDTISTDLHKGNVDGPAYDLSTVMTKLLHVGMPLQKIIEAVTSKPALMIGKQSEIGSLSPGTCADVSILRLEDCDMMLEDTQGQMRRVRQRIVPVAVWRNGQRGHIMEKTCPNQSGKYLVDVKKEWDILFVRDQT